jgi:hypothetical protein
MLEIEIIFHLAVCVGLGGGCCDGTGFAFSFGPIAAVALAPARPAGAVRRG